MNAKYISTKSRQQGQSALIRAKFDYGIDRYLAIYNRAKLIWQGQELQAVMDKAWIKFIDPEYRYI